MPFQVEYHKVIMASLPELVKNLNDIQSLMDHLAKDILLLDDIERVNSKPTQQDKARELLRIVCTKQDTKLRDKVKHALQKSGMGYLNCQMEEKECLLQAKIVIQNDFVQSEGSRIPFNDFMSHVKGGMHSARSLDESEEEFSSMVTDALSDVFDFSIDEEKGKSVLVGVAKKEHRKPGSRIHVRKKVKDWSKLDVHTWLCGKGIQEEIAKDFLDQDVSGLDLEDITEDDLKGSEFPHVNTLGKRKEVLRKLKELLEMKDSFLEETKETFLMNEQTSESEGSGRMSDTSKGESLKEQLKESVNGNSSQADQPTTKSEEIALVCAEKIEIPGKNQPQNPEIKKKSTEVPLVDQIKENIQKSETQTIQTGNVQLPKSDLQTQEKEQSCSISCETDVNSNEEIKPQLITTSNEPVFVEACQNTVIYQYSHPTPFEYGHLPMVEKYHQMAQIPKDINVTRFIDPTQAFIDSDLSDERNLVAFTRQVIQMICGALNARTNARIYVGIGEDRVIRGTPVRKEFSDYDKLLQNMIKKCFKSEVREIVLNCVRPPKFVKVATADEGKEQLYVLEIDVIPGAKVCCNHLFPAKLPDILKSTVEGVCLEKTYQLFNFESGTLTLLDEQMKSVAKDKIQELNEFRKYRENHYFEIRKKEENIQLHLKQKLLDLLGLNSGKYVDLYPILVISRPDSTMDQEYIASNLSFFANTEMKAVFDFDPNGTIQTYLQQEQHKLFKVIPTTDEFDECSLSNRNNPEKLASLQEEILNSKLPHWIFCNGFNVDCEKYPELSQIQWHKTQKEGFKESVNFFKRQIPQGRAVIIFVILSEGPKMMTEAIQEFMSAFPEQWVFIAENNDVITPHFDELMRRSVEEQEILHERSVVGLPFNVVQEAIIEATGYIQGQATTLPCSDGKDTQLNDMVKNELTDLEILSSTECDHLSSMPESARKELEIEEENYFYKGGEVSWKNLWFEKHVLKRSKHTNIYREIKKIAQGETAGDSYLGKVILYHQPGAGATTMAKQVLWDSRKMFRCAIVRNKTDQTASQISLFRSHHDKNPMPVLLLLDNLDEEPATSLLAELELLAKQTVRNEMAYTKKPKPYCVVLVCLRRSKMPLHSTASFKTHLKHELNQDELKWFKRKFADLETRFGEQEGTMTSMINPKLLISFNIMKQNFDEEYITRITTETIGGIESKMERRLLKYVALLNAYDLNFKEVPCAAFDSMMITIPWQAGKRRGRGAAARCWEANLSDAFKVLINETSSSSFTSIKAMRITNPLLSRKIIDVLKHHEGQEQSISQMILEFFSCREIFSVTSHAKETLLRIIKDLMKRRNRLPSGNLESKFAPMIQDIVDNESADCGMKVLEMAFELTKDPFVAQQVARLCISTQKWELAVEYAQRAIDMKPDSSFLWDTNGRIYHTQLADMAKQFITAPDKQIDLDEVLTMTKIAMTGAEIFRRVQSCSEQESTGLQNNNAGYYGELEIIECLLHCLRTSKCFKNTAELKKFLVETDYYPDSLKEVDEENSILIQKLKTVKKSTEETMHKLEDERMQLHDETLDEYRENSRISRNRKMEEIQTNLDFYLGEHGEEMPKGIDLQSDEACRRRRRRIRTLGGTSSRSIFDLKLQHEGEVRLNEIRHLCLQNIQTDYSNAMDYQVAIAASITLVAVNPKYAHGSIQFSDVAALSHTLYEKRNSERGMIFLEPYLFLVLFNWPRQFVKKPATPKEIQSVLDKWKEAYYRKWPKQIDGKRPNRQKDKTIFFFANGGDMASIVGYHEIKGFQRGEIFWKEANVLRTLKRFEGRLSNDGEYVNVQVNHPSKQTIEIPTSFPIRDRKRWNQRVFFVIGFSWKGPKAFDISLHDPTEDVDFMASDHKITLQEQDLKNEKPRITHAILITKLTEVNQKLEFIKQLKKKTTTLKREEEALVAKEDKLIREREALMWNRLKLVDKMKTF